MLMRPAKALVDVSRLPERLKGVAVIAQMMGQLAKALCRAAKRPARLKPPATTLRVMLSMFRAYVAPPRTMRRFQCVPA
ncbi:hypothetical protein A0U91_14605 (plasmid) [Acetobacter persici]|uniref:Uncharacterized protein n=1 Tax=Acetobacter persici TaxID=1076596 RepID=A0A1U9LIG3_9PROT|nr:hypothetical protein [Acetobacter persici]AQT06255.1 hypothetical protein A0U91_14605 [Acetobacter persici]